MMKAIMFKKYGSQDVLEYVDADKPVPGDDQVLVKVHATSINAAESHIVRGDPILVRPVVGGLFHPRPTIPGADVAGVVEAVGKNVTRFKVGDEVFGDLSACGWGAYAEYVNAAETALAHKPANLSFEEAAAVPLAAVTAVQGLRKIAKVQPGQKVLVNGAAGGVGSFAVQIAKAMGAEVTAAGSTAKMDMVRSLGADHVVDYTREDVTRGKQTFDVILDAAAYRSVSDYKRILKPGGVYVLVGGSIRLLFQLMLFGWWMARDGKKCVTLMAGPNLDDLTFVKELLEAGKVKPVIDRCYPLHETAAALRLLEDRHVRGKAVISVEQRNLPEKRA